MIAKCNKKKVYTKKKSKSKSIIMGNREERGTKNRFKHHFLQRQLGRMDDEVLHEQKYDDLAHTLKSFLIDPTSMCCEVLLVESFPIEKGSH